MLLSRAVNAVRLFALRSRGARVGRGAKIGRGVYCKGNVTIEDDSVIGNDVILSGNVKIGRGVRIEKQAEIHGNISIDESSIVGAYSFLSTLPGGALTIGRDVYVNAFSVIGAAQHVAIGDHCIFAAFVQITDATHGIADPKVLTKNASIGARPVRIGRNVWLGSGAMVTMGVSIGDGAVIGAKALVTKDVPPNSVAYGIPARVARSRTPDELGKA